MTRIDGNNGASYVQNPAQIFAGQPQQVQQPQQQYPQQIIEQQQYQQPQQQYPQYQQQMQPNYVNGQVNLDEKQFNLSEAGKELLNMMTNAQQPMNGQMMVQQPPQESSFFNTWYGKGALVAGGGLAGYGIARMTGGPSGNDMSNLVNGVNTLTQSSGSDVIKAIKSFF